MRSIHWGFTSLRLKQTAVLMLCATALGASATCAAETAREVAVSGAMPARPAGVPSDTELVALLRATLAKVDYGNKTGDYHDLRAELTPQVQQAVDLSRLASALEGFRKLRVDMSSVARAQPLYERAPEITPDGLLLLRGTFPTSPREVRFDFGFVKADGRWRVQALNLDTPGTSGLSTAPGAAAAAAPQGVTPQTGTTQVAAAPVAARRRPAPKPVDSPFLDTTTDPPTATKW